MNIKIGLFTTMVWSWMVGNPELTAGLLTSLILLIGVLVAYKQLTFLKRTEQGNLIKTMSEYWDSNTMAESREALRALKNGEALSEELERCLEDDFQRWLKLTQVGNFFEEMGNLVYDKAIDSRLVTGRFRSSILMYYEVYEAFIRKNRPAQPAIYIYFEWLSTRTTKMRPERIRM